MAGQSCGQQLKPCWFVDQTVAGLGAFMSSTGVVAIFIPVVLSVAMRMQNFAVTSDDAVKFCWLISGMMTLVATPPNLGQVVNSELLREISVSLA